MTTIRVRIDEWIIKKLMANYENQIIKEHGIKPNDSQVVMIALLELEALKCNQEVNINFLKNGKITYKFR